MASSIQLLRSTIAQERPFPGNLLEGQPAVNLNASEPGLFFKAADGSLIKVGPAAITSDGSPPNASAAGLAGNTVGEMWLDKSLNPPVLKIYDGAQWVSAGSGGGGSSNVTLLRWTKTVAGGETSLSGPDDSAQQLSYTPGLEQVFLNGVLLERGVDYSGTNGSSFSDLSPLSAGDLVIVLAYSPFSVFDIPDESITGEKIQDGAISNSKVSATAGIDSSKLSFLNTRGGASGVSRSVRERLSDVLSVKDFGALGDASQDDSDFIQAAIDYLSPGSTLFFPKGRYKVTKTIIVSTDVVHLMGDSPGTTTIIFEPTADDTCFFFGKGGEGATNGGVLFDCSIKNFYFSSPDTTRRKIAIDLKDVSKIKVENVNIGSTIQWVGNQSIGIKVRGREGSSFKNLIVATNRPFVFGKNLNSPSLCLDQFSFENIFTACRGHIESPPIYDETHFFFEPGVNFSNVSFSGYQSWNRGKNGIYYDNSSLPASASSYSLSVENVRWEGTPGDDDSGHAFYFDHGSASSATSISFKNCYLGEIGNGYLFRNTSHVLIENCVWGRNSGTALDIGSGPVKISNCFWQTGCSAVIPSSFKAYSALGGSNASPIYRDAVYSSQSSRTDEKTGGPLNQFASFLDSPDPTTISLPIKKTSAIVGIFTDSRGKYSIVGFNSVSNLTTVIFNDGTWSSSQGNPGTVNIFWDAIDQEYKAENKTGLTRILYFQALGSEQ